MKVFIVLAVVIFGTVYGQEDPSSELYKELSGMDSVLFAAFNQRDLETIKDLYSPDLEFYHDIGGLTNYDETIANSAELFNRDYLLTRTLEEGSMEVYPIKGYGAIQKGKHTFCHKENGKDDCGTFEFMHIWKKTDSGWKLTRVISYGH